MPQITDAIFAKGLKARPIKLGSTPSGNFATQVPCQLSGQPGTYLCWPQPHPRKPCFQSSKLSASGEHRPELGTLHSSAPTVTWSASQLCHSCYDFGTTRLRHMPAHARAVRLRHAPRSAHPPRSRGRPTIQAGIRVQGHKQDRILSNDDERARHESEHPKDFREAASV